MVATMPLRESASRIVTQWDATRFASSRFCGLAELVTRFTAATDWPTCDQLNDWFADEFASVGVRAVVADKMRTAIGADGFIDPQSLYEVRLSDTGDIPTRPRNLHDFLNALIWAGFPQSKRALTSRLAHLQRSRAVGQTKLPVARSRVHDRCALLDEGGLLLMPDRSSWIFGHAILEHAYAGMFDVRAAGLRLTTHNNSRSAVDQEFASIVRDDDSLQTAMVAGAGQAIDDAALRVVCCPL
jgi:hypothetical protein